VDTELKAHGWRFLRGWADPALDRVSGAGSVWGPNGPLCLSPGHRPGLGDGTPSGGGL